MDTFDYSTLLFEAAAAHNVRDIELLLTKGADPNTQDENLDTPIYHALRQYTNTYKVDRTIELLLEKGSNPHIKNKKNETPLHIAVTYYHNTPSRLLLNKGANPNTQNTSLDTTLHIAIKRYQAIVPALLEKGANANIKNKNGNTPLYLAAWYSDTQLIKLLLENGADPTIKNKDKETALHRAGWWTEGIEATITLLLAKGANIDARDKNFETPLHFAAWFSFYAENVVKVLLEKGADPNARNNLNWTPLHYAVEQNCQPIVELLLDKGVMLNLKGTNLETPLQHAARKEFTPLVKLLLKHTIQASNHQLFPNKLSQNLSENVENLYNKQDRLALLWGIILGEQDKELFYTLWVLHHKKKAVCQTKIKNNNFHIFQWVWNNNLPIEIRGLILSFLFEESILAAQAMFGKYSFIETFDRDTLQGLFATLFEKQPGLFFQRQAMHLRKPSVILRLKELSIEIFQNARLLLFPSQNSSVSEGNASQSTLYHRM